MSDLLTTAEVAERFRVTVSTVNRYARENLLRAIVLPGGVRRFRVSDIEAVLGIDREPDEGAA